ncbi:hypothetical protein G6L68_24860 [Agrobacterium fabrum]|uniref:hypothetical protein n=1 Tax=Agrobacterium fabrum TaxID=1176649 RepID=UPI0013CE878F|nr:hypothetical protein [Agrobacterium fabrum]NTE63865.1 hypothetical protein [Agrobacterium fabrum]
MRSWQSLRISPDAGLDRISALREISELEMNIIIAKGIHRTIAEAKSTAGQADLPKHDVSEKETRLRSDV